MKIAFYLPNKDFAQVDCSKPESGNPGIGGTEYMIVSIPYFLGKLYGDRHEYLLLANCIDRLPANVEKVQVDNLAQVPKVVELHKIDLLVLKYSFDAAQTLFRNKNRLSVAFWTHNFVRRQELTMLAHEPRVKVVICVGNEQLNIYRDHQAYDKSVVIFNGYPIENFKAADMPRLLPFSKRNHEVTYIGNLVAYKGFPLLARAWRKIVEQVPDAHLNVIGGGALYDRNSRLGKWGLAEEKDEQEFMPYLIDEEGKLLSSVTFWGVLGKEKDEVLNRTKVGVPNPGGVSETFCIAAIEMQLWGGLVTTIRYGGFIDTVGPTGLLYGRVDDIADCVASQLRREDNEYGKTLQFLEQFSFERVCCNWILLFDVIASGKKLGTLLKPQCVNGHKQEEFNRRLKALLPFGRYLPTWMFYRSILLRVPIIKRYV